MSELLSEAQDILLIHWVHYGIIAGNQEFRFLLSGCFCQLNLVVEISPYHVGGLIS